MCCCNVLGPKMPLYIIQTNLKNLPDDLLVFSESGQVFFCQISFYFKIFFLISYSGWQNRDIFLWFVIIFINWLTVYGLHLKEEIRDDPSMPLLEMLRYFGTTYT